MTRQHMCIRMQMHDMTYGAPTNRYCLQEGRVRFRPDIMPDIMPRTQGAKSRSLQHFTTHSTLK